MKSLILASASPRRASLLRDCVGDAFEIVRPSVEELQPDVENAGSIALKNA